MGKVASPLGWVTATSLRPPRQPGTGPIRPQGAEEPPGSSGCHSPVVTAARLCFPASLGCVKTTGLQKLVVPLSGRIVHCTPESKQPGKQPQGSQTLWGKDGVPLVATLPTASPEVLLFSWETPAPLSTAPEGLRVRKVPGRHLRFVWASLFTKHEGNANTTPNEI